MAGARAAAGTLPPLAQGCSTLTARPYNFTNSTTFIGLGAYVAGGGATFGGAIVGTLNWLGGTLSGVLTIASESVLNIEPAAAMTSPACILTNYGTVNWTNTHLYGRNGLNAHIYNYGLWNEQSDDAFSGAFNGGPSTLFDNFGTFLKSGGPGETTLAGDVVFNNTGTVNVQSGTLAISGGGASSGGDFITAGGGIINFNGGRL